MHFGSRLLPILVQHSHFTCSFTRSAATWKGNNIIDYAYRVITNFSATPDQKLSHN